jgi:hypothetical protein
VVPWLRSSYVRRLNVTATEVVRSSHGHTGTVFLQTFLHPTPLQLASYNLGGDGHKLDTNANSTAFGVPDASVAQEFPLPHTAVF